MEPKASLNLVLLKTKGSGNSTSGSSLLGREAFKSKERSKSVTQDVAVQSVTVCEYLVTVYDTRLSYTDMSEEENQQKYEEVLQKCNSRPCVFLLAIKADRFTQEEQETVEKIEKLLGENHLKTWILFTNGEQLEKGNMTIKEFIDESEPLKKLVQKFDQRYHVFKNKSTEHNKAQFKILLLKMIQTSSGLKASEGGMLVRRIPAIKNTPAGSLSSRRIVLVGKTGVGKSAAGNTILGQEEFKSVMRMSSVTIECSVAHGTVSGRSVSVVDTPGFFDTKMTDEELMKVIARSVYISCPGPHTFLIVFRVDDRFTEQEEQIPQMIEMVFGQEVLKYSIILFTRGDQLDGESVGELIEENCRLRHLVDQCGGRFHVFNNKDQNNREQVNDLLKKIDTMIEENGGGHYSNQMYEDAQRFRREEEERRQREEEERRLREEEEREREEEQRKLREEEEMSEGEEEQRKQQEEKQKIQEIERKLEEQKYIEFDQFHKLYEQRFSHSASVMSEHDNFGLCACIGGVIGGVAGIPGGTVGVAAGVKFGAAVGAAVSAAVHETVSAAVSAVLGWFW